MSGIFLNKEYRDDKSAFTFFIENSICNIKSVHSQNAIVLKLELNDGIPSPYGTTCYSNNLIDIKEVKILILKFVVIENNDEELEGVFDYYPDLSDEHSEYDDYEAIYKINKKSFFTEALVNKIIFNNSFLIDYQVEAICPDILLCMLITGNEEIDGFLKIFKFNNEIEKKIIIKFFEFCKNKPTIEIGCIVMEYIDGKLLQSLMFNEQKIKLYNSLIKNQSVNQTEINKLLEEYELFLVCKAKLLIAIDKLHYLGFVHYDLHTQNSIYKTDACTNNILLIDFGTSFLMEWQKYILKLCTKNYLLKSMRGVPFDSFDMTKDAFNKDYISTSIINLESNSG